MLACHKSGKSGSLHLKPHFTISDIFYDAPKLGSLPAGCKRYNQLDYFKKIIRAYQGRDEDAVKYVKKVKALIDKPLDEMIKLEDVRLAMAKVKCPCKLDISVFYQLTRRLPHEDLNYDDERLLIHFYDTFYNKSTKLLGCMVRWRSMFYIICWLRLARNQMLICFNL